MSIIDPSTFGSLSGSGIGEPVLGSTPFAQLPVPENGLETRFFPFERSSTKNHPARDPCANNLRGVPLMTASNRTGVSTLSQSCVSCGDAWKYHTSFPVSGFSATMDAVYRLAPFRLCPANTGFALPVPQ